MKKFGETFLVFLVYADDILIASNDDDAAYDLKNQLSSSFQLRDLGPPKFFFGIEIAMNNEGITLSQKKYVLDLLESTSFLIANLHPFPWSRIISFLVMVVILLKILSNATS